MNANIVFDCTGGFMSIKKVIVDSFLVSLTKDGVVISLEMDEDVVEDAILSYDGRNCAVLTVNNEKAYLLTNILPNSREALNQAEKVIILQLVGDEVSNGYEVNVQHVEEIPYPDTLVEDIAKMLDDVKEEIGEEKFDEIIDTLVRYNERMQEEINKANS